MKVKTPAYKPRSTHRQAFLQWLFRSVKTMRYGVLKYFYASLNEIPSSSDIDLIIDPKELKQWQKLLESGPGIDKVKFSTRFNGCYVEVFFSNQEYLELDLLYQLRWRDLIFLDCAELLDRVSPNEEGIKVVSTADSFSYLIAFFTLNNCPVPAKYQSYFGTLNAKEKLTVLDRFATQFELENIEEASLFINDWYREAMERSVRRRRENKGLSRWKHYLQVAIDSFNQSQPTITFSGVDGAGKSTIIEKTKELLTEKYRREVVVLRQRPSILPILSSIKYGKEGAEKRAATTLPRQGTNKSRVSSVIRFVYYLMDYLLGQAYVYWTVNRRGKLLLYDRYYFDYIVDSRRANINLGPKITAPFYRLIRKHEINILLYADPKVILARKQELTEADISSLTQSFLNLFETLQAKSPRQLYLPIQNVEIAQTMGKIEKAFITKL
ncbi:MAG: hypothetical protein AAF927_00610 [Bacteroidota bacterium]